MNGIRRGLLVLGLTMVALAGTAGSTAPAQATFSDSATVATSIETATVAAPTQVEAKATCTTTYDPVTLTSTTTAEVKVEWWQSTSPGVTGYFITVYPVGGSSYELARTGPTDEVYTTAGQDLLDSKPRFTVTTLTSYGWTAESRRTAVLKC